MSLELLNLPDDFLVSILGRLPYKTCRTVGKSCHRLFDVLNRHKLNRRDDVEGFEVYICNYDGEKRMLCSYYMMNQTCDDEPRKYYELQENLDLQISDHMKTNFSKVRFMKKLLIGKIKLSDMCLNVMLGSDLDVSKLQTIRFHDCQFDCNIEEFTELTNIPSLIDLEFVRCSFSLTVTNPGNNGDYRVISLTDEFLEKWSSETALQFHDTYTQYTLQGVQCFIKRRPLNTHNHLGFVTINGITLAELEQTLQKTAEELHMDFKSKVLVETENGTFILFEIGLHTFTVIHNEASSTNEDVHSSLQ